MRVHWFILGFFIFLFVNAYPLPGDAKVGEMSVTKEEGPVDIEADELIYERETQLYQAHGQVEVYRGDFSLKADHAQLNMETKDLVAWGNVLLREGEDVIECQRLEVNLETRIGKIHHARLFLKEQNFHITGKEAEKLGENHYRIRDGSLTTCDAKRPPWKFNVKELEVKEMDLGGWGIAKGVVFHLEDIPVLYFPWGTFPVRQERQTGFLIPQVGYSNQYGPEAKTGFYWAFAKDMDTTFYFDYLGERGFKEGLEYRYALTQETQGQASFYFIDDQVLNKNRYAFFVQHQQKLPYDFYLKGDINYVSDHDYLYDFDEDFPKETKIDSRSSRQLRSVLFGGKNWDQFSFIVDNEVFDNLTQTSNDETVQILPQISFYAHPQSLFKTPLFYDLASSYTHFYREKGVEAQRGDLFPRLSYPIRLFDVLKFESDIGVRETYYKPSYHPYHYNNIMIPNKVTGELEPVDSTDNHPELQYRKSESRETLEAEMQLSTEFYRVYNGEMISKISDLYKVSKWMHTIEPMISYQYSPRVNQSDIPVFDEVDRIPYTNQVTFGITQRLIGKPEKEGVSSGPYEYGKLTISQSYSFGDPYEVNINNSFGNPYRFVLKEGKYFSNIRGELWWNFNPYITAHWDAEINPHRWDFDRFNFVIKVKDRRDDVFQVQFRNTKGNSIQEIIFDPRATTPPYFYPYSDTSGNLRQINLDARVKTVNPLYLFGGFRYDLLDHYNVVNIYGVEYQAQCWSAALAVEQWGRSPDGTRERELKINFYLNLLNIGSIGHKPYLMGL
jgi:LPS-assembly protein